MDESTKTISQRFKELPLEMQKYVKDESWISDIQTALSKRLMSPQKSEEIKFEMFLYLLAMQDEKELAQQIRDTLPDLPTQASNEIYGSLIGNVPKNIRDTISGIFSEIDKKETENTPKITESKNSHADTQAKHRMQVASQGGMDILPERRELEDNTTLGRNSLIKSIEHPEEFEQFEKEERQKTPFNPIASKLNSSTSSRRISRDAVNPNYNDQDPYREPTS